jgi:hypothetical protein
MLRLPGCLTWQAEFSDLRFDLIREMKCEKLLVLAFAIVSREVRKWEKALIFKNF